MVPHPTLCIAQGKGSRAAASATVTKHASSGRGRPQIRSTLHTTATSPALEDSLHLYIIVQECPEREYRWRESSSSGEVAVVVVWSVLRREGPVVARAGLEDDDVDDIH